MVTVNGTVCFAFSTIFTPKKDFNAFNIYLNEKMFPNIDGYVPIKIDNIEKYRNTGNIKFSRDEIEDLMIKKAIDNEFLDFTEREWKRAQKNEYYDLPIKEYGLGKRGIELIEEYTHLKTLGAFLKADPEVLATKIQGKSERQIKFYQKMGREKLKILEQTIKDPKKVVTDANIT